jgi:hypothetical protein
MTTTVEILKSRVMLISNNKKVYPLGAPGLAMELGVDERKLRAWLRTEYGRQAPGKGGEWIITIDMVIAAARWFKNPE